MTAEYSGKRFSVLGDSISTLERYTRPSGYEYYRGENMFIAEVFFPRDTWWGQVIDALGGELLVNNSIYGSTVIKHPAALIPTHGSSDERTGDLGEGDLSPDVIMILMGINDWGYGVPPMAEEGEGDLTVFSVAYGAMLSKLRRNYPEAELWCFTLPVSDYVGGADGVPQQKRRYHLGEYSAAIRAVAEERGCRIIDLYAREVNYKTVDNYHPNAEGMRELSEVTLRELSRG